MMFTVRLWNLLFLSLRYCGVLKVVMQDIDTYCSYMYDYTMDCEKGVTFRSAVVKNACQLDKFSVSPFVVLELLEWECLLPLVTE